MKYHRCPPFTFSNVSPTEPTEFMVFFCHADFEFRYTLAIYNNDVVSESLYKKNIGAKRSATLFERDINGITLGSSLNKKSVNTDVSSKIPFISFLSINYDFEIIEIATEWFFRCTFADYDDPVRNTSLMMVPGLKEDTIKIMSEIDIPISDIEITLRSDEVHGEKTVDKVHFIRDIDGDKYKLNIFEESGGTFKLFGLLPHVLIALKGGMLMVVDEMDAGLHPKLLRHIVKLFKNPKINKHNAQVVFTSHDITTMKSDLFRRDEIWFASKDDSGASEIYSLYEIRNQDGSHVKADAPFYKQYIVVA
ncbi:MAG: ATP-binding protein [Defluviitaleaceae bacterium]|nr:ATP-binding protein [Defluviitaleaceae bacterium]